MTLWCIIGDGRSVSASRGSFIQFITPYIHGTNKMSKLEKYNSHSFALLAGTDGASRAMTRAGCRSGSHQGRSGEPVFL